MKGKGILFVGIVACGFFLSFLFQALEAIPPGELTCVKVYRCGGPMTCGGPGKIMTECRLDCNDDGSEDIYCDKLS